MRAIATGAEITSRLFRRALLHAFVMMIALLSVSLTAGHAAESGTPVAPAINGPYMRVYVPSKEVFPGPDSEHFRAGQSYADWVPNDHAILKGPDGRWHALGITHPEPPDFNPPHYGKGVHDAEWLLFHAVSPVGALREYLATGAWRDTKKVLVPAARPGEIKECHAPFYPAKRRALSHDLRAHPDSNGHLCRLV